MNTHLQEVRRLAPIDRLRSAPIEFDETTVTRRDFRLARGGIEGLYETSKMEIGVQVIWDGSLAAGCGGSVDICDEVCTFEEPVIDTPPSIPLLLCFLSSSSLPRMGESTDDRGLGATWLSRRSIRNSPVFRATCVCG